jgi:hypothetical protein
MVGHPEVGRVRAGIAVDGPAEAVPSEVREGTIAVLRDAFLPGNVGGGTYAPGWIPLGL